MKQPEIFESSLLKITLQESDKQIDVKWNGKSADRDPSIFLTPILLNVL